MHINRHINKDISTCTSPFLRRLRCAHDTVVHVGGGPGSMPTKHCPQDVPNLEKICDHRSNRPMTTPIIVARCLLRVLVTA